MRTLTEGLPDTNARHCIGPYALFFGAWPNLHSSGLLSFSVYVERGREDSPAAFLHSRRGALCFADMLPSDSSCRQHGSETKLLRQMHNRGTSVFLRLTVPSLPPTDNGHH